MLKHIIYQQEKSHCLLILQKKVSLKLSQCGHGPPYLKACVQSVPPFFPHPKLGTCEAELAPLSPGMKYFLRPPPVSRTPSQSHAR